MGKKSDMKSVGYTVVRGSGTVVSRHRTIAAAERALKRYLNKRARKTDRVRVFAILNPRPIPLKANLWGEQVRAGVIEDANGKERKSPYGAVLRLWATLPGRDGAGSRKRRSSRRRSR